MQSVLALDVGTVRVGVARGSLETRLASPFTTLDTDRFTEQFAQVMVQEQPVAVVVGLPRNLSGEDTPQTTYVREFAAKNLADITVVWQDEALTSRKAEEELQARKKPYTKGDIDALAASYILEDYFSELSQKDTL